MTRRGKEWGEKKKVSEPQVVPGLWSEKDPSDRAGNRKGTVRKRLEFTGQK